MLICLIGFKILFLKGEIKLLDKVYYRVYYFAARDYITIVCMQDFDESDYTQENFLLDKFGYKLRFECEDEAIKWLNENVKTEKIDPEYTINKLIWKNYLL
jgi:hypothetical protein